jgi:Domain of unknown function (DUF4276)
VVREIWLHVEGGGNSYQQAQLRQSFSEFLRELQEQARRRNVRIRVVFWGPRSLTYEACVRSLRQNAGAVHLLLVDAEGPVSGSPRQHLIDGDGWDLAGIGDDRCHLMVQVMESWFLADPEALSSYFGQGFAANALPPTRNVEQVAKQAVYDSLARAARNTKKAEYDKGRDTPQILKKLDARKVRDRAPHCDRLLTALEEHLSK